MAEACTQGIDTGFVALGYGKVAVLGVVQGITELLPISSTAHMRIVPALFGWQDPGSAFSAAMQLAALTAVVSYFWSDVRQLVFGSLAAAARGRFKDRYFRLAVAIVLATIPIGLAGLALAGLKELWELHKAQLDAHGWAVLAVGLVVASISAFVAIWALLRVLERYSAWPFAVYRVLIGVLLLVGLGLGWFV